MCVQYYACAASHFLMNYLNRRLMFFEIIKPFLLKSIKSTEWPTFDTWFLKNYTIILILIIIQTYSDFYNFWKHKGKKTFQSSKLDMQQFHRWNSRNNHSFILLKCWRTKILLYKINCYLRIKLRPSLESNKSLSAINYL